jgi:hypothetical protein
VPKLEQFGGDELARTYTAALIRAAEPGHFTGLQAGQLVAYGLAMAAVQRASEKLQRKRITAKEFLTWSDVRRRESMVVASLATKLRITATSTLPKSRDLNARAREAAAPASSAATRGTAMGHNPLGEGRGGSGSGFVQ